METEIPARRDRNRTALGSALGADLQRGAANGDEVLDQITGGVNLAGGEMKTLGIAYDVGQYLESPTSVRLEVETLAQKPKRGL